ncbi:MAG: efflux RND transporter periplasmic adaptor subunit [Christensenellales bacterium]
MKKTVAIVAVAAVIAWCVYSANMDKAVQVEVSTVKTSQMVLSVEGEGHVEAKDSFMAIMPVSGKINMVNVTEGQSVLSSSTLFTLEPYSEQDSSVLAEQDAKQVSGQNQNMSTYAEFLRQVQTNGISYDAYMDFIEKAKAAASASAQPPDLTADSEGTVPVISEITGTVLAVNVSRGSYAQAGSSAVCIGSEERVVRVLVYEKDFVRVKEGQAAVVDFKKLGIKAEGVVKSKSQTLQKLSEVTDPAGEIIISLKEKNIAQIGSSAFVTIEYECVDHAVLIPIESLIKENELRFVYVMENGRANKRRIKTGISDGKNIQVLEGVLEGETVIVNPPETLTNGERVAAID